MTNKIILVFLLAFTFSVKYSFGQESTGTNYYYNNFEGGTLGATATRVGLNTIDIATTTPSGFGLASTATSNTLGYIRWSFFGGGSNYSLAAKNWEWEFDYTTTLAVAGDIDQVTPGANSWRYWLTSNGYSVGNNGNNSLGVYITQKGTDLILRYKKGDGVGQFQALATIPVSPNIKYQVRVVRSLTKQWKVYLLDKASNTTVITTGNFDDGSLATSNYKYSYIESNTNSAGRFKWDNLNMYSMEVFYEPVSSTLNGITLQPIVKGQTNVIPYGVGVKIRGDIEFGRIRFLITGGNAQSIYSSGKLYKSLDNYFSTSDIDMLKTVNIETSQTNQINISEQYFYSSGNIDGTLVTPFYFFLLLEARNPFYNSSDPTNLNFTVSQTADDNYGPFFQSSPVAVPKVYDWVGAGSTPNWSDLLNFKFQGNAATDYPRLTTDIVQIGVSPYQNPSRQPVIDVDINIGKIIFGSNNNPKLTVSPSKTLSLNIGLQLNAGATSNIAGSGTINMLPNSILDFPTSGTSSLNIDVATNFVLKSTSAGSASVGNTTNSTITGNFSIERFMKGGTNAQRGYRLMSSPVVQGTQYNVLSLKDNMYITGAGGATNGFDASPNNGATVYKYKESNPGPSSQSDYAPIGSPTDSFNQGQGMYVFYRGLKTATDANGTSRFSTLVVPEDNVVAFKGSLIQGDVIVNLSYTPTSPSNNADGFNLVGNPYAATIDLSSSNMGWVNLTNFVYVLNPTTKVFGVFNRTNTVDSTGGASRYIASGQGFFVQATSNITPSITFKESAKSAMQLSTTATPRLLMGITPLIPKEKPQNIHLSMVNQIDSNAKDDIVLVFNSSSTTKYIETEDAYDFGGNGTTFLSSLSSDQVMLAINSLPSIKENMRIPIVANSTVSGNFNFEVGNLSSIEKIWNVFVVDHYIADSIKLNLIPHYGFTVDRAIPATYATNRFELSFREKESLIAKLVNFSGSTIVQDASLSWKASEASTYNVIFTLQRSTDNINFTDIYTIQSDQRAVYYFKDQKPGFGVFYYRLKQEDVNSHTSVTTSIPLTISNSLIGVDNFVIYPNPVKGNYTIDLNIPNVNEVKVRILDVYGKVVQRYMASSQSWTMDASQLATGMYILELINAKTNKLIGRTKFSKL